jgi:hypothetical protein
MVTHTGLAMEPAEELLLDEAGAMLLRAPPGVGVIDDRDLAPLVERLGSENDSAGGIESLLGRPSLQLFGRAVRLAAVRSADIAGRFGFEPVPRPPEGKPDCS